MLRLPLPQSRHGLLAQHLRTVAPICVAVAAEDIAALFAKAGNALAESLLIELRLDSLPHPRLALEPLGSFALAHPEAILLATCRRVAGGGGFAGSVAEQLTLLAGCAGSGASIVDLELETLEAAAPEQLESFGAQLRAAGCALLVSSHDFRGPSDAGFALERLKQFGAPAAPSLYKVVNTAACLADTLAILRTIETNSSSGVPVTGICMGMAGVPSRVLALRAGAPFTFGSLTEDAQTAPGQVPARALRDLYRVSHLTAATRVYGVAGNPVAHSLSPAIHNAAFQAAGVDAVYLPLHTVSPPDLFRLIRELPLHGVSVTMPWKIEILPWLDSVDALTRAIGAVNTIVRRADGSLHGTNTDAAAVTEPLALHLPLAGARILLAGAGGAARAAAFALVAAGAEVSILNRTEEAARRLAQDCGGTVAEPRHLTGYDVIVNATPAGMLGVAENELPVPRSTLAEARVVFEMVYRPVETPLVRAARASGVAIVDGLAMFAHQGARQWEIWTGFPPPQGIMRKVLKEALGEALACTLEEKR